MRESFDGLGMSESFDRLGMRESFDMLGMRMRRRPHATLLIPSLSKDEEGGVEMRYIRKG